MNKLKPLLAALALCLAGFTATQVSGCKTSQQTIAYKSLASVEAGVSASLNAWADYVVAERKRIASLTGEEQTTAAASLAGKESKARAALDHYKQAAAAAQIGVSVALANSTAPAPAPLIEAGAGLVSTLTTLK